MKVKRLLGKKNTFPNDRNPCEPKTSSKCDAKYSRQLSNKQATKPAAASPDLFFGNVICNFSHPNKISITFCEFLTHISYAKQKLSKRYSTQEVYKNTIESKIALKHKFNISSLS